MSKVLVVEDEPNLQVLYKIEIEAMGHRVICAADGRTAMERVRVEDPDLVVLDIMMPQGDGLHFLGEMLSDHYSVPVIINSAYSHYKSDFITWAADAYVVKSSDVAELKSEICRAFERRHVRCC